MQNMEQLEATPKAKTWDAEDICRSCCVVQDALYTEESE